MQGPYLSVFRRVNKRRSFSGASLCCARAFGRKEGAAPTGLGRVSNLSQASRPGLNNFAPSGLYARIGLFLRAPLRCARAFDSAQGKVDFVSPLRGSPRFPTVPRPYGLGSIILPLRGWCSVAVRFVLIASLISCTCFDMTM